MIRSVFWYPESTVWLKGNNNTCSIIKANSDLWLVHGSKEKLATLQLCFWKTNILHQTFVGNKYTVHVWCTTIMQSLHIQSSVCKYKTCSYPKIVHCAKQVVRFLLLHLPHIDSTTEVSERSKYLRLLSAGNCSKKPAIGWEAWISRGCIFLHVEKIPPNPLTYLLWNLMLCWTLPLKFMK